MDSTLGCWSERCLVRHSVHLLAQWLVRLFVPAQVCIPNFNTPDPGRGVVVQQVVLERRELGIDARLTPAGVDDGDGEGRPRPALPFPDAVRAGLSAGEPGDGVRRA